MDNPKVDSIKDKIGFLGWRIFLHDDLIPLVHNLWISIPALTVITMVMTTILYPLWHIEKGYKSFFDWFAGISGLVVSMISFVYWHKWTILKEKNTNLSCEKETLIHIACRLACDNNRLLNDLPLLSDNFPQRYEYCQNCLCRNNCPIEPETQERATESMLVMSIANRM